MNIQIFGTKKSFDTKKAQRYFKERRISFQFIDLKEKGMSKGELQSVANAVGGLDKLINPDAKDADTVALLQYLAADQKFEKVLDNQQVLCEPVVRNGKKATVDISLIFGRTGSKPVSSVPERMLGRCYGKHVDRRLRAPLSEMCWQLA